MKNVSQLSVIFWKKLKFSDDMAINTGKLSDMFIKAKFEIKII